MSNRNKWTLAEDSIAQNMSRTYQTLFSSPNSETPSEDPVYLGQTRCKNCLLLSNFCQCSEFPPVDELSAKLFTLCDVVVYYHYREYLQLSSTNTARFLNKYGAQRILMGDAPAEALLRDTIINRGKDNTFLLFPSTDSITVDEYLTHFGSSTNTYPTQHVPQFSPIIDTFEAATGRPPASLRLGSSILPVSTGHPRPLVIVVDGTWPEAKTLNRRLGLLLDEVCDTLPLNPDGSKPTGNTLLHRVKLSRSWRGDMGSLRRLQTSERGQATTDNTDTIIDETGGRVGTLHAFLVLLEELAGLPMIHSHGHLVNRQEDQSVYDVLSLPVPSSSSQIPLHTLHLQNIAYDVVYAFTSILKSILLGYHTQMNGNKSKLLDTETKNIVKQRVEERRTQIRLEKDEKMAAKRARYEQQHAVENTHQQQNASNDDNLCDINTPQSTQ